MIMRMMKNNNNETVMVIGIDHGYGNMKTATRCFPSGVARYDKEPIFQNNLLVYNGMYYQIGEEHKEFCAEKTQDEDYYVLTLAAIARELDGKGMNRATVHIAAGLPLTWVATQKEDFQKYLLQNECVDFTFRNKEYHVEFAGADIYPQGFTAAFYRLQDFKGINMLVDIGNGTMNIMYINNSRPLEKKCFTEKYGTHQCVLAVRESLLKELGTVVDDLVIEQVIRTGTADIGEKYLTVIRKAAGDYTKEIFHKLREREYNPELMRLYVVGGGGCMIQNFGEYDKSRVTIVRDICATAKGYEAMTVRRDACMRKELKIINTNIRLNLCDEQDRQAWEYLQTMDREKYKSYTRAVVVALNDYFSREYRNEADPYLETREKEDAFLERVETAIRDGVKESVPMDIAKNLMEMLVPFVKESVGEINLPDRTLTMEKTDGEIAEDNLDWEKEADMDAALDFADSF